MSLRSDRAVIDLTAEPEDHLTALPSELLHLIFDYVFPSHVPDIAFLVDETVAQLTSGPHDLEKLARTCHSLHDEVKAWAGHWLKSHIDITRSRPPKGAKKESDRSVLRGRGGLFTWKAKHCIFCGKQSYRSAIFCNGFRCCMKCDLEQWPDKITKTKAKEEFHLHDHQLLPDQHTSVLAKHGANSLPRLLYGTYMSANVRTTMFLRDDVRRLAEAVHGDVEAHMAAKKRTANARREKMEANAERKRQMVAELTRRHGSAVVRA